MYMFACATTRIRVCVHMRVCACICVCMYVDLCVREAELGPLSLFFKRNNVLFACVGYNCHFSYVCDIIPATNTIPK